MTRNVPHVHYEDEDVQIRSGVRIDDILTTPISERVLPGRLASYIYPSDAILVSKANSKWKDVLQKYATEALEERKNATAAIFDVLPEQEKSDEDEDEEEVEDTNEDGEEDEEEEWEEDDEVEEFEDIVED